MIEEIQIKYCTHCGLQLFIKLSSLDIEDPRRYAYKNRFNSETGEKLEYQVVKYTCPKYRFWNTHDDFFIEK